MGKAEVYPELPPFSCLFFDIITLLKEPCEFTEFIKIENKKISLVLYANKLDLFSQTGGGLNIELILPVNYCHKPGYRAIILKLVFWVEALQLVTHMYLVIPLVSPRPHIPQCAFCIMGVFYQGGVLLTA